MDDAGDLQARKAEAFRAVKTMLDRERTAQAAMRRNQCYDTVATYNERVVARKRAELELERIEAAERRAAEPTPWATLAGGP
jgi:hypothetical protein